MAERGRGVLALWDGSDVLLVRQVLFGAVKFLVFESCGEAIFDLLPAIRDQAGGPLAVSAVSGLVAGVLSSFVSQPADTVLSRMNEDKEGSFLATGQAVVAEQGIPGLWTGFGPRCVWAGSIISGQFLLYDIFRDILGVTPADLTEYLDPLRDTFEGVVAASP